jgi:hypothetical protein
LVGGRILKILNDVNADVDTGDLKFLNPVLHYNENIPSTNSMRVDGEILVDDLRWEKVCEILGESVNPYTFILDFNTLDTVYGRGSQSEVEAHLTTLIQHGGTGIGFVWRSPDQMDASYGFASNIIRLRQLGQQTIMYGTKPFSPIYVLNYNDVSNNYELQIMI